MEGLRFNRVLLVGKSFSFYLFRFCDWSLQIKLKADTLTTEKTILTMFIDTSPKKENVAQGGSQVTEVYTPS